MATRRKTPAKKPPTKKPSVSTVPVYDIGIREDGIKRKRSGLWCEMPEANWGPGVELKIRSYSSRAVQMAGERVEREQRANAEGVPELLGKVRSMIEEGASTENEVRIAISLVAGAMYGRTQVTSSWATEIGRGKAKAAIVGMRGTVAIRGEERTLTGKEEPEEIREMLAGLLDVSTEHALDVQLAANKVHDSSDREVVALGEDFAVTEKPKAA